MTMLLNVSAERITVNGAPKADARPSTSRATHLLNPWSVDRRTADRRVVRSEFCADPRKIQNTSDLAYAVIAWNDLIETERIEEPPLVLIKSAHHRQPRR